MKKKGLTIIEMMVSMLIFSIVMAMVISIFITQSRKSSEVSEKATLFSEAQIALNVLSQEVLHAGLCVPDSVIPFLYRDGDSISPDTLLLLAADFPLDPSSGKWTIATQTTSSNVIPAYRWADTTRNFKVGDYLIIVDNRGNPVWNNVLNVLSITTVSDSLYYITTNLPAGAMSVQKGYVLIEPGNSSRIVDTIIYMLDGTTLERNGEIFLDNVEDFEVRVCADWDNDGNLDFDVWRDSMPQYSPYEFYTKSVLLRISLLVRTEEGLVGYEFPKDTVQLENRIITLSDVEKKFPRAKFSNVIYPRNLKR